MGVRVKMQVNDEVSSQLNLLGAKSPQILDSIMASTSLVAKRRAQHSMRRVLQERTGKMLKGVRYRRTSRARYTLRGPNLASIYEFNGAEIFPKNADFLQWQDASGQYYRSNWVSIEPKPFFYSSMRDFVASGEMDRNIQERIDIEIAKAKIKL